MIRTSFEIVFYCRRSKANRKGLSVIELAISMNGKRSFIALPKKMDADEFCNAYRKKIDDIMLFLVSEKKTYATTLLNKGVSISVVARTLGHSNTNITQKVYAALRKETVVYEINKAFDNGL